MEYALVAVAGIVVIVAAAAWAPRLGVAAPLILVVVGVGYSLIPGVPPIELEPDVILYGVLPPLLYAAAITVPFVDFRRNLSTITLLSVVLVVASALITGFLLHLILPGLGLAAAIALGAVISPPDVVAATSIAKRMGLPARLVSILEGEGLVNDATALVLLRAAIAASALVARGETFVVWSALGDFAYALSVAVVIGLVTGVIAVWVRRKLDNPMLDTAISFAVPFIAFLPAEELHGSGVISVVVAGLYSGHQSAKALTPQSRISERFNWRTLQFVLENGVFLLMGAQISTIISNVHADDLSVDKAILLGVVLTGVLIVVRYAFVIPLVFVMRGQVRNFDARDSMLQKALERMRAMAGMGERFERRREGVERRIDRRRNDLAQLRAEGLGLRGGVILGWAGMRGVVTLAAAQSLPRSTPYYEQLVLIAFTVAISTLLLQGSTLPILIRAVGIRGTDRASDRRELAALLEEMSVAGIAVLDRSEVEVEGVEVGRSVVARVREDTLLAVSSAWERAEHADEEDGLQRSPHQQYRSLRREVLAAERDVLLEARAQGTYPSRILQRAQSLLDLEQARLEQLDTGGRVEE
ncbi:sodium:proton antiporter [Homoserinibacter sp. GY 40078]|uniref:cation:proton antiporter n=1 Tax=Homoserinibacter sp. GY 40078 TaxID=2603275 RepID=UPI0011C73E09|nr:sodium:proton antiporter [Homoserinibacter sp. GY 40078]TXK17056.1 sodium:proton antiporter [Homoserinibacter sp. GY 40078]